jgi:uncharacterized protein
VNARNTTGATPLHDAALAGNRDVAAVLIAHGADINARDHESGSTPLHLAASWGRIEVLRLLLEKGADRSIRDKMGRTAAEAAKASGQADAEQVLGAQVPNSVLKRTP